MTKNKLNHIVELDGLRGFAVLIVMFYHFMHVPMNSVNSFDRSFENFFLCGWIGVDLFFVLSGFLITRILINTKFDKNYFKSFYYKRTLRIFPLYYLYLILCFFLIIPYTFPRVTEFEQQKIIVAQQSQVWFFLYLSNIKQAMLGFFLGSGLGHLWTLAIEEQFYIFWPMVVKVFSLKNLKRIAWVTLFVCLGLRFVLYFTGYTPVTVYSFTLTRIDTLVMGGLVAFLYDEGKITNFNLVNRLLAVFAILTVSMLYAFGPRATGHPVIFTIGFSLIALSFTFLLTSLLTQENTLLRRIFSLRILVFLGKYSYAIYMFHPMVRQVVLKVIGDPVVWHGTQIPWEIMFTIVCSIISVVVALISWNLFEKWFLKLKSKPSFSIDTAIPIPDKFSEKPKT
jgi:peptidoglycan/LPS O-acetylase OafA/YrhL